MIFSFGPNEFNRIILKTDPKVNRLLQIHTYFVSELRQSRVSRISLPHFEKVFLKLNHLIFDK